MLSESIDSVVVRRNKSVEQVSTSNPDDESKTIDEDYSKHTRLNLMEEIFLLGLKDREGYTSFWNDNISFGLRGCLLVELAIRGRISLEPANARRRSLLNRHVIVKKNIPTGDMLLDEALRTINSGEPAGVKAWIDYLSGETWNPLKITLQMRQVRERIAKNLVEKGVCTTEKQNFVFFDMTTHPLINSPIKQSLINQVNETLLRNWPSDVQKMNKRTLSLIIIGQRADVLENSLTCLSNQDYNIAMKHIGILMDLTYSNFAASGTSVDVIWAVFEALRS